MTLARAPPVASRTVPLRVPSPCATAAAAPKRQNTNTIDRRRSSPTTAELTADTFLGWLGRTVPQPPRRRPLSKVPIPAVTVQYDDEVSIRGCGRPPPVRWH